MDFRLSLPALCRTACFGLVLAALRPAADGAQQVAVGRQPQLASSDDGSVYLVFGTGSDIQLTRSTDGGGHFDRPRIVAATRKPALGMRRGPRIAAAKSSVTVTAIDDGDLYAFHSDDAGATWSSPHRINSVAASAKEGLHNLAQGPDGRLFVTWLDLRSGSMEVFGAASMDAGKTWLANERVYRSPDGHVCECCHPSVAFNSRGDLVVMWRNWIDGCRDLWTVTRRAGSDHFAPPVKQGIASWKISGCPMDGGSIIAQPDGSFASVWRRDQDVFLTLKPGTELKIGRGTQPIAALSGGTMHLWWQRGPELMHTTTAPDAVPAVYVSDAAFATVASSPTHPGTVIAFERTVGQQKTIFTDVVR